MGAAGRHGVPGTMQQLCCRTQTETSTTRTGGAAVPVRSLVPHLVRHALVLSLALPFTRTHWSSLLHGCCCPLVTRHSALQSLQSSRAGRTALAILGASVAHLSLPGPRYSQTLDRSISTTNASCRDLETVLFMQPRPRRSTGNWTMPGSMYTRPPPSAAAHACACRRRGRLETLVKKNLVLHTADPFCRQSPW